MSVQNAGTIIREARQKAGLTQEQLSEGVCSTLSLSRIENNTAGVSPSTFQALMAHANASCEAYPGFANRTDFDCFYALKRTRFFLDTWLLQDAFDELEKIEQLHWADNRYYYQEWLLLQGRLQLRSGCGDPQQIFDTALSAIHISRPEFDSSDFRKLLLSLPEIELCILLAHAALCLENTQMCFGICSQISAYLGNSATSYLEKDRLLAENAIVYAKYLIKTEDYEQAVKIADTYRHLMVQNFDDAPLFELTFLTGLGHYFSGDSETAFTYIKTAFFSAHSIKSCYAAICFNYVNSKLTLPLKEAAVGFALPPLTAFPHKKIIDTCSMNDGTYDLFSPDVLNLGALIRELRTEQHISQAMLCQGLCSKSKLSKIENGSLQPGIILAQTLLQRLGISDLVFTFYGNEKETRLTELHTRLNKLSLKDMETAQNYMEEMQGLISKKDTLYLQQLLDHKIFFQGISDTKAEEFFKALSLTLPNLDINCIRDYRLSWTEASILNSFCSATRQSVSLAKAIQYLYKIFEYFEYIPTDILEKKRIFPVTLGILMRFLYAEKRYTEALTLNDYFTPTINCSLYFAAQIYVHYFQCLGECKQTDSAYQYATYARYCYLITEQSNIADSIANEMQQFYNIHLL